MKYRHDPSLALLALIFGLNLAITVEAAPLPRADLPENVGLDSGRLEILNKAMQKYVDDGKVAGLVTLIMREGQVAHLKSYGWSDVSQKIPMANDAIFRIASQTKAITSVAVMMLFEEGRLQLKDPVSKYIPGFSKTFVASSESGQDGYTVAAAKREINLRDLLTHTAGISYGGGPAKVLYDAAGFKSWFFADKEEPIGFWMNKLASLPFDAQPGEKFVYGYNTDLLGYIVEKASGMSLAEFFQKRITEPLGMNDTHFFLPTEKLERFTPVYGVNEKGALEVKEEVKTSSYVKGPRSCYAGGAGLLSTAEDYGRFLEMLRQGGELNGVRLLSPKSVQLMTVNHVGTLFGDQGFGLGFWVTQDLGRDGLLGTPGAFGWGGAYFTCYWVDPTEKMVALLMTQLMPAGNLDLQDKFKNMVYQSIVKSHQPWPTPSVSRTQAAK